MCQRSLIFAPLMLLLASVMTSACNETPASPTEPGEWAPASLTAEPATLTPEFLHSQTCSIRPAFRVRLSVILRSGGTVILSGLRFHFIDRFGERILPRVTPISTPPFGSTLPSSSPVPIPGVAPLPSSTAISGALPFFATFDCNVLPDGILVVVGDVKDAGTQRTAEMRLRVLE